MLVFLVAQMIIVLSFQHFLKHRGEHLLEHVLDVLRTLDVKLINQFCDELFSFRAQLFYLSGAVNREIEKVESRRWRAKFQSNR